MRREVPAIGRRRDSIVVPSEVYPFVSFALQNLSNKGWQFAGLVLYIYLTYRVIRVIIACELGAANASRLPCPLRTFVLTRSLQPRIY